MLTHMVVEAIVPTEFRRRKVIRRERADNAQRSKGCRARPGVVSGRNWGIPRAHGKLRRAPLDTLLTHPDLEPAALVEAHHAAAVFEAVRQAGMDDAKPWDLMGR